MRKPFLLLVAFLTAGCSLLDRQGPPLVNRVTTNVLDQTGGQPSVGRGKEVVLTIFTHDPDNDELDFTWTALPLSGAATGAGKFRNPRTSGIPPQDTLIGVFQDSISVVWQAPAQADAYLLRLRITDGKNVRTDSLLIRVTQRPPTASAGQGRQVPYADGRSVTLDGTGSADPDRDDLTYIWTQITGPGVALTNDKTATPLFRPPAAGDYRFVLQVFDGADSSNVAVVVIRVNDRGG